MNRSGQTVCVCMIVKNERHVLHRCLDSIRSLIDHWVIVDTGSTDGTQAFVQEYFHGTPGELIERPWKNFGHNRSESIALARGRADYVLIMDADEFLAVDEAFVWPRLTHDAYDFSLDFHGVAYTRVQLVRSALPWRYQGVLHEYITCDTAFTQARMAGVTTVVIMEGDRSSDPLKYRRDALVLEEALLHDPTNARYMFYLAQSYRDAGEVDLAIDRYGRRASMGGFEEEVWCSLYESAKLLHVKGAAWPGVQDAYLQAFAFRPQRAEPLYRIGLAYQHRKEFVLARMFLSQAMQIAYPVSDDLFVEADVYRYFLPLEYAVACYWLGRHEEAVTVTDKLLEDTSLSTERRDHLLRNRNFSTEALRVEAPSGSSSLSEKAAV